MKSRGKRQTGYDSCFPNTTSVPSSMHDARLVEAVLAIHAGVKEVAVVGVPSPLGEEDVAAFVVPAFPGAVSKKALHTHCASRLAGFKVPSHWRFLEALPRTSTQRVAKHLLKL